MSYEAEVWRDREGYWTYGEVWRRPEGHWTYALLLDGEIVTDEPLLLKAYHTREEAIEAATREARRREHRRNRERVPLNV